MLAAIFWLIGTLLEFASWVVIASVILNLLQYFELINRYSPFIRKLEDLLYRLTEPMFAPIRKYLPSINGIDLSPMIVLLAIQFLSRILGYYGMMTLMR
jgi:YggT family protein